MLASYLYLFEGSREESLHCNSHCCFLVFTEVLLSFLSVTFKNRLRITVSWQCRDKEIFNLGILSVSRYSHHRAPNTSSLCSKIWLKESGSSSAAVFRSNQGS